MKYVDATYMDIKLRWVEIIIQPWNIGWFLVELIDNFATHFIPRILKFSRELMITRFFRYIYTMYQYLLSIEHSSKYHMKYNLIFVNPTLLFTSVETYSSFIWRVITY